jgi:protein TonB
MQTNQILSANLLDLLFDNRNKEYGAYELRNTYQRRITKAMLVTGGITLMIFAGSVLAKNSKPVKPKMTIHESVEISKIVEKEPEVIKPKEPEVKPVKSEQFTTKIEIKPDNEVKQPPPSQDDLINTKIDVVTQNGVEDNGLVTPTNVDDGKGIIEDKKNAESDEPFRTVEVDATFTGNWQRFLEKNLNPEVPIENGAPAGNHTVEIQFVVDIEGNVSDIKALTNLGYGMEQEAVRVLKKATKWEPAIQNGRKVKAYRRQRITFQVLNND